jgi:tetratricopeptide (TPR) repeat protein
VRRLLSPVLVPVPVPGALGLVLVLGALVVSAPACERKVGGSFSKKRVPGIRADARTQPRGRPRATGPVRRVLLFTAKWCPTCHQLKKEVLGAPVGRELLAGAVFESVDFDKAAGRVAKHSVTGLPTTVFLDGQGRERDRIEGFEGKQAFVDEARAILAGRDLMPVLADKLLRQPKNLELRYRIGRKLLGRGREKEGFAHYDKVVAADPQDRTGLLAKILMHRSRYLVRVKRDYPAAVAFLRAAIRRIPTGRAGESLRYWLAHALCLGGKPVDAVRVMDAYVKQRSSKAGALLLAAGIRRKCAGGYELKKALSQARSAVKKKPKNDWGWYLVAVLSERLKSPTEARRALDRAIALAPHSAFYAHEKKRMTAEGR